jgi:hypothetical protein
MQRRTSLAARAAAAFHHPRGNRPVPRLSPVMRSITVAMAIVALAAPVAAARQIEPPKANDGASPSARVQDLRHLKAGPLAAPIYPGRTSDTPHNSLGPVYWSYDYEAQAPKASTVTVDDGTPWTAIGLGIAGACLLLGAGAAVAARTRVRSRKPRIAT